MADGFNFGFSDTPEQAPQTPAQPVQSGGFDFGFSQDAPSIEPQRYHAPKSLGEEIQDKGFLSGVGSWMRDDGSTVLKRHDGQTLQSGDGGETWEPYKPMEGDYQSKKGGPIVNIIAAGQKPGTITHHNPIVPLPGEDFQGTMKRAVEAGKRVTPEQIKEEGEEDLMNAPGTMATAASLGAVGPVVYGGAKGVSVLKQAIVGGDSQILGHPENMMTPESRKAHPYWAGALETIGGLSTPEMASMMIGGGALNKLPGPAAKIASRLVSGGFGITMLANAVKNVPELWDAMRGTGRYEDMSDDDRESIAKNLMFHITADAAMGAQAAEHGATGTSTPLTEYGEAADMMASKAARAISEGVKKVPAATINSIGSMLGRTSDFDTAIKRSSKIPSKQVAAHMDKIANVREDLQSIMNDNPSIESPKNFADKINEHIQSNENALQKKAGATKGSDEPVVPGITQRLIDRLDKFFDDNKGLYGDTSDVLDAKKRILEGILQSRNGQHLQEPNLFEAENVRRRFSRDAKPQFATNATPTTDAYKAGALEAASELRDAIDESYSAKNVDGVQDFRTKEANLIDIRDRLYDAQDKAEKAGEGSVFGSLTKKIGVPSTVVAIALGHPVGALATGAAVLGDQIAQNLTNPNVNVRRAAQLAARNPQARTTVPVERTDTPIHGILASHYGEPVGKSTYHELEGRFMAEIAGKGQRGIPLESDEKKILTQLNDAKIQENQAQKKLQEETRKNIPPVKHATLPEDHEDVHPVEGKLHDNMGTQEALVHGLAKAHVGAERGIDLADGITTENGASTPIDWTSFIGEDGKIDPEKVKGRAADLAATYVAGRVANDLWHGIPFTENKGLNDDITVLKAGLRSAGFSGADVSKMVAQAVDDATTSLSRPNVREIMEQHAQVREPGLDDKHHFSPERLEQVIQDLKQPEVKGKSNAKGKSPAGKPSGTDAGVLGPGEKAGAGTEVKPKEGDSAKLRQEAKGPAEGKGAGVRTNEPAKPAEASEPGAGKLNPEEPEDLITSERQSPLKRDYQVEVIDQAGESKTETIPGFSGKDALKTAQKKFPGKASYVVDHPEAEPENPSTKYTVPTGKTLSMPESDRPETHTMRHELGHAMVGLREGMEPRGMYRHTHTEMPRGTRAAVSWSTKDLIDPGTRRIKADKLPGVLRNVMGGIAADEAFNDLPRSANINFDVRRAGGDGSQGYQMLRAAGYDHDNAIDVLHRSIDQAKEYLTNQHVSDIIKENEGSREPGLSRQYHYSPDRFKQMHLEAQRRINAEPGIDNGAVSGEGSEGRTADVAGREGGGQEAPGTAVPQSLAAEKIRDAAEKAADTKGEGFSFNPKTGETPTTGHMVETIPEAGKSFDHPPTADEIRQYVADNKETLDKHPELHVGGYRNTLGISGRYADEDIAHTAAKKLDQISRYDLEKGKEVETGGTGKTTSFPDYPIEQRLADLSESHGLNTAELKQKSPKGSTVPLMENPLKIKGTGEAERVSTLDVAKALNKYTTKKLPALEIGKAEPAEQVERAKSIAEDEAKYQLHQNNSGKAWYTTDIGVHDDVLQRLRPELKDPAKMSLFKMSEAVLSSGQKPYQNLKAAIKAWDHYNETGEFPATNPNTGKSWGPRGAAAYGNAMQSINKLIQERGEKGASDWLLSEHPVSELRQYNKLGISGKQQDSKLGAMILGEKRGPFAQNLHGIESAFTADMWVSRTWNRWMGTLDTRPTPDGDTSSDAPKNNTERKLMSQSFEETAKKLNLTTSSLQAILWYYEQGLYDVHGSKKESWSFADAAKRVEKEHGEAEKQDQGNMFGEQAPAPKPTAPAGQVHALDFMKLLGGSKK